MENFIFLYSACSYNPNQKWLWVIDRNMVQGATWPLRCFSMIVLTLDFFTNLCKILLIKYPRIIALNLRRWIYPQITKWGKGLTDVRYILSRFVNYNIHQKLKKGSHIQEPILFLYSDGASDHCYNLFQIF